MNLSNRELAENPTWPESESFLECPECGFLSEDLELIRPAVPCPNCGVGGRPRRHYPDLSSCQLLRMIAHFYARAQERQDDTQEALTKSLAECIGRTFDRVTAVEAARKTQELRVSSSGSQEDFEALLAAISDLLRLSSVEEARKAFVPLLEYSDTNDEHQVVVLLTATMLEQLFRELLLQRSVSACGNWEEARRSMNNHGDHGKREHLFKELTGEELEDSISGVADQSCFYSHWRDIRKLRNKFVHGAPFVIRVSDTEKAFELAKAAFTVFAALHNCVTENRRGG